MAEQQDQDAGDRNDLMLGTVDHVPPMPANGRPGEEANDPTAGTVAHRPVLPPCRPGRYTVHRLHARGGMGEVWLAEDLDIGRPVALKRLRKERSDQIERFLLEARVTGQLDHPGIVPLHDLGADENGQPFYIMSFVGGKTFKDVIADYHGRAPKTEEPREVRRLRLLEVFVQLCRIVAYAHSKGVIHRDIKPDNVMVGPYGETLVLDWGLAKVLGRPEEPGSAGYVQASHGSSSTATLCGVIIGAPPYMAPEEAEGKGAEADERTDVYLLGSTLYEVLTGRPPRRGSSKSEMIELARTVPVVPPREIDAGVPRALDAICGRAMGHRKQDRYATALELAEEMQRYLAGEPVAAYPEPWAARAWRWGKRHRRALGRSALAAAVLGLVLFGLTALRASKRRETEAAREVARLERIEQARRDVREFRQLAGELHFHAASTDAPGEQAPFFDRARGEKAGHAALALARQWGADLEELPLPEERVAVKAEQYALLLLLVQLQSYQQKDRTVVDGQLALLDQAEVLAGPSSSLHRLRGECYHLLREGKRAVAERKKADDPRAPRTALDHFLQGEEYRLQTATAEKVDRDMLGKAIVEYQAALEREPDHYWAHFQLGRCQLSLGQTPSAVQTLGSCVALRPKVPWGYSARGLALISLGQFANAERDLNEALEQDPEFLPALLNRGVLHWRKRELDKARADFGAVLSAPPDRRLIKAAYYRGLVELERGDYAEALKDFDLLAAEQPSFWPVYLLRARAHFWLNQDERGLADLGAYLARPGAARLSKAETYEKRGTLLRALLIRKHVPPAKVRLARAQLLEAVKLGGKSASLFRELGAILESVGDWTGAIRAYSRGLAIEPRSAQLRVMRGWANTQCEKKDYKQAREDFTQAVRADAIYPDARQRDRAEAYAGLGFVHAKQGAPPQAQTAAALALLHGGDTSGIVHNVACIFAELAEIDPARCEALQDVCLQHLSWTVGLWLRVGGEPDAMKQIEADPSLAAVRRLPKYDKLKKGWDEKRKKAPWKNRAM